jgi:hypothetical protein
MGGCDNVRKRAERERERERERREREEREKRGREEGGEEEGGREIGQTDRHIHTHTHPPTLTVASAEAVQIRLLFGAAAMFQMRDVCPLSVWHSVPVSESHSLTVLSLRKKKNKKRIK